MLGFQRVNERGENEGSRGSPFLILDLGLDIIDSIGGLDLKGDCLSREAENGRKHEI